MLTSLIGKLWKVCEVLKGDTLVSVESCHISGISYKNVREGGILFLKDLVDQGLRVQTFTTCNPQHACIEDLRPEEAQEDYKQLEILSLLRKLGVSTWLTCTPYEYLHIRPRRYYAWSESSAVAFINSVCDAYCEKFPGMLAIVCAVVGLMPRVGLAHPENRVPRVYIEVKNSRPLTYLEHGLLGMFIAKQLGDIIPYLKFNKPTRSLEHVKALLAAYATYCNNTFIVIESITSNFKYYASTLQQEREDKIVIVQEDIEKLKRELNVMDVRSLAELKERCELIIGCPHFNVHTVRKLLDLLSNLDFKVHVRVFTSRFASSKYVLKTNLVVTPDTCMFLSKYVEDLMLRNISTIITNSVKQFYYLAKVCKYVEIVLADIQPIEQVLNSTSLNILNVADNVVNH